MVEHPFTKPDTREIIRDFARDIRLRWSRSPKPSKAVIHFRRDHQDRIEREVVAVPIELLRYRKENGRIASDVEDYEKNTGPLDEKDASAQAVIAKFLEEKDPQRTDVLRKSIQHDGQRDPAIITCDGFLINGNRRKLVMEQLHTEFPNDPRFAYMNVVILPGEEDEPGGGGPPTLLEIEEIESRYQLQSDGKSEYYGFDRALSVKRKIAIGLTLEKQLGDDPQFAGVSPKELEKAVADYTRQYLAPLECVDRYLRQFGRVGQYRTISTGMADPEGRWQAFIDYNNAFQRCFSNAKKRAELGIAEDEIGAIEESAFDIIRLRNLPGFPKVHMIMRELPKYCQTKDGKKELLAIADDVVSILPPGECVDEKGVRLPPAEVDAKWAARSQQNIIWHLKKARTSYETRKEKETPLGLLDAAYKKLTHPDMDPSAILLSDLAKARKRAADISERATEIEGEIYQYEKAAKKLNGRKA